jgi:hypothetical protein
VYSFPSLRPLPWVCLSFAVACAPAAEPRLPALPPPETVDLASEFVASACSAEPGAAFAQAWRDHEDKHKAIYEPAFYKEADAKAEREKLSLELGPRRDEMCGYVRTFLSSAPSVIESLRPRVAKLLDAEPRRPLLFVSALQWTDGAVRDIGGKSFIVLNARHDTFSRTRGLSMTIAHELVHDAQETRGRAESLTPFARTLYREGAAVYGVTLLFPELGDAATGMKPDELARAKEVSGQAAAKFLVSLDDANARDLRRFFQGGYEDAVYPPKMGYFIGLALYRRIAEKRGGEAAVRIAPEEFLVEAKKILAELAR